MKLLSNYVVIFLCGVILSSCSDDKTVNNNPPPPVDTSSFTYPFTIGSIWNYQRTFSAENIRPDSIRHYFSEFPVHGSGTITILYDTLINGITTRCFHDRYTEYYQNDSTTWHSRTYYGNYDTALVCYAYRYTGGGAGFPYTVNGGIRFKKNNITFINLIELFSFIDIPASNPLPIDTLIIENLPVVCLKYPIAAGTEWLFKDIKGLTSIYKKYISFENLYIQNHFISCIKTERRWTGWDDLYLYDYHSKYGQIKRDYLFKDMLVTTVWNPEGVGYVDLRDVYNVTSYNIITP